MSIKTQFTYKWFRKIVAPDIDDGSGHWSAGHRYHSVLGEYDSSSPGSPGRGATDVFYWQTVWALYGNFNAELSSWWGVGGVYRTHENIKAYLTYLDSSDNPYPNYRVGVLYELEQSDNPTAATIKAQLDQMRTDLFGHTSFLRMNKSTRLIDPAGDPVVYVYQTDNQAAVDRHVAAKALYEAAHPGESIFLVCNVFTSPQSPTVGVDSWINYDSATNHYNQAALPWSVNCSPGFWRVDEVSPRLVRDYGLYAAAVYFSTLEAACDFVTVTTGGEHFEGSIIEPCFEFTGDTPGLAVLQYLDPGHYLWPTVTSGVSTSPFPAIVSQVSPPNLVVHLFSNNVPASSSSRESDFTESTFVGYTSQTAVGTSWVSDGVTATYDSVKFRAKGTTSDSVYGYYVMYGSTLVAAERFPDAPVSIKKSGDGVNILLTASPYALQADPVSSSIRHKDLIVLTSSGTALYIDSDFNVHSMKFHGITDEDFLKTAPLGFVVVPSTVDER